MGIIGSIRKHSWVAVAIVGIAIVAFIIGDLTKNNSAPRDMGKVNSSTFTVQSFNLQTEKMENNYKRQQGVNQISSDVEYQIREQVWQTFVDENILGEQFDALGLTVTPAEMSDMYAGNFIHPFLRQQFTDPQTGQYNYEQVKYISENFDQLDTALREQWVEMEKAVKENRMQMKYQSLLAQGFYMPKTLANVVAGIASTNNTVNIAALPYSNVTNEEVKLDDKDYQAYYDEHKQEYRVREEMRDIDMVLFDILPSQQDLQDIEDSVNAVWNRFQMVETEEIPYFVNGESDYSYDSSYVKTSDLDPTLDTLVSRLAAGQFLEPRIVDNQWVMAKVMATAYRPDSLRASAIYVLNQKAGGSIMRTEEDAKALADSLVVELKSGRLDFEKAVNDYSDDPQKANNMGDMEWQLDGMYGFLNEQIVNTPVGDCFSVKHPAGVGYFVVKVTGKTNANKKYRLALISREIAPSEFTSREVYNKAHLFASDNRTLQEMQASAQAEGLQIRSARLTSMMNTVNNIANSRSIVQWAFNEKTEMGTVANQVYEAENVYAVVALKDIYKKGYATLEQVRSMIENEVMLQKKGDLLLARAEEAANGAASLSDVATKLGVSVDTVNNVSFNGNFFGQFGMEPKMMGAVAAAKPNTVMKPVKGAAGVYVGSVVLSEKLEDVDPVAISATFEQSCAQKMRSVSVALRDRAKIVDHRNIFF